MQLLLDENDDLQVLESIRESARQLRRKKDPAAAITAGKIELAFSKALEEIRQDRENPGLPLGGDRE